MSNLLIGICGRAGSKGFANKNLKDFCGRPLVYYTLSAAELFCRQLAAQDPEVQVDLALNTDSQPLADLVAARYPEAVFLPRSAALGGDRVPKMAVFQDTLRRMEQRRGGRYDWYMDLDITSPLRTAGDIAAAFAKKRARGDLDLVFSVCEARRNPWFNMVKEVGDHVEQVNRSAFTARQQAPAVYDVNASLYVFERDFLHDDPDGMLWNGKIGVSVMMDTGIIDIDSEHDYRLMEAIAAHLYRTYPEYRAVQENIRG